MTPHVAGDISPAAFADHIIAQVERFERGLPLDAADRPHAGILTMPRAFAASSPLLCSSWRFRPRPPRSRGRRSSRSRAWTARRCSIIGSRRTTTAKVEKLSAVAVAGNPKGDVTLYQFYDLNCPYCRQGVERGRGHHPRGQESESRVRALRGAVGRVGAGRDGRTRDHRNRAAALRGISPQDLRRTRRDRRQPRARGRQGDGSSIPRRSWRWPTRRAIRRR